MKLQSRDLELFYWINGFGFMTIPQIAHWMGRGYETARRRVQKLSDHNFLIPNRILHHGPTIYRVSNKGCAIIEDPVKPLAGVRLSTFRHDAALVDLALYLYKLHPKCQFVPERRLRAQESHKYQKVRSHNPDGHLILYNSPKPIAIELELTQKSRRRLHKIIRGYQRSFTYERIWYFVPPGPVEGVLRNVITTSSPPSLFDKMERPTQDPLFRIWQWEDTPDEKNLL
ncbi:MAG: hypothetical protein AAF228_13395 [Pseudomonadota bacterium]